MAASGRFLSIRHRLPVTGYQLPVASCQLRVPVVATDRQAFPNVLAPVNLLRG
ncbi:hypothetical protein [Longitalea luteola]|uniref:hypothetical protein n=1 Tax=Longitalea luteola TaxID=2812563 RepID=UPI001A96785D|nr:hypothetical protein [Longitalea luteola]